MNLKSIKIAASLGALALTLTACSGGSTADWGAQAPELCGVVTPKDLTPFLDNPVFDPERRATCYWEDPETGAYLTLRVYQGTSEYKSAAEDTLLAKEVKHSTYSPAAGSQDSYEGRYAFNRGEYTYIVNARLAGPSGWVLSEKQHDKIIGISEKVTDELAAAAKDF